ncbi:MAG: ribonuclease III domain-containing protein [Treponema sp.]|nr:ribonuclease III domain-containing protein [Treponema sp.]MEE3435918.1 ribonuclease III domain-containing protein [Treponema sp.]
MKKSEIEKIQSAIGYQFKNAQLLEQAFTRKSFAKLYGGQDNDTLEFFGDRILNLAVIKDFFELDGHFNPDGKFVSSKTLRQLCHEYCSLVNNTNLAERIDDLELKKYLRTAGRVEKLCVKSRADLFEAIIGAVALDSDWSLQTLSNVFHCMMYSKNFSEKKAFDPADYNCYNIMRLVGEKRFVENMDYSEQLHLLRAAGVVSEPHFRFEFYPCDSKRRSELWRCFGSLEDSENEYEFEASTRFEAQEEISRAILCYELKIQDDSVCSNDISHDNACVRGQGLLKYVLSRFGNAA